MSTPQDAPRPDGPAAPPPSGWPDPAASAPGYPPPPPPAAGWPAPAGYAPPVRTADAAVWALVSAIGSWLVCPVVLAVVALVLARTADDAIDRSGGALTGHGLATASRVVAWLHLAVVGLALLFGLAVLVGLAIGSR